MKNILIAAALVLTSSQAFANEALAQKNGCLACHSVQTKILGPTYKDVAAKYKGQPDAKAKMVAKVSNGGSGAWGPMPMPAMSPQVSKKDIETIVDWVLASK